MKDTTHQQIIRSARELFAQKGFKAASMADIAGKVGITKAALYYFFKNKEHIYGAIIADMVDDIERCLTTDGKDDTLEKVIQELIEIGLRTGTMFRSIEPGSLDRKSILYKEMGGRMENAVKTFQTVLCKHGVCEPELAGEVVLNAVHAYVLHAGCRNARTDPKKYSEYLARTVKK